MSFISILSTRLPSFDKTQICMGIFVCLSFYLIFSCWIPLEFPFLLYHPCVLQVYAYSVTIRVKADSNTILLLSTTVSETCNHLYYSYICLRIEYIGSHIVDESFSHLSTIANFSCYEFRNCKAFPQNNQSFHYLALLQ